MSASLSVVPNPGICGLPLRICLATVASLTGSPVTSWVRLKMSLRLGAGDPAALGRCVVAEDLDRALEIVRRCGSRLRRRRLRVAYTRACSVPDGSDRD